MKSFRFFLIAIMVSSLCISCNKNDDKDSGGGTLLEIDPAYKCYVSQGGDQYYANLFSSISDADQYQLAVEKGVKYRIHCCQPGIDYAPIDMVLLNSDMDTITKSYNYEDVPKIVFNSGIDGRFYLRVYPDGSQHESLDYRLYFEVADPQPVHFINLDCDYTGYWEAHDSTSLKFTGKDAHGFRWFRFNWSFQTNPGISFTLKSSTRTELPAFGFAFNGSTDMVQWNQYRDELPENSTFVYIEDSDEFKVLHFDDHGVGYNYGSIDPHGIDLLNGVNFNIKYSGGSYGIYLNNTYIYHVGSELMFRFYLVVEDLGFDELIFENFQIE